MKSIFLSVSILISFCFLNKLSGKDKDRALYPASAISPELKKDAFAVCREYRHEFELTDYGKAVEKVHLAVTVLEENGDHFSKLYLPYDQSQKIKSITGRSYDQLGIADDKLKNSAIQDVNYTSGGAIYDDLRLKIAEFKTENYPYTIEYDFEIEHNGLIRYPEWQPLDDYRIAIEKSSFKIIWPESMEIRFREKNLPEGCKKEAKADGKRIIEWTIDSLPAWKDEPMSPSLTSVTPKVTCAPTTFIYDGSTGKMSTWEELGQWAAGLNAGLDRLSDARTSEIKGLISGLTDTLDIVQTLYKYMQKRTRYVGIQMGLGGYKPFPAETVDRLGYGDCKALSNYMKALLNCAGIRSFYTLAGAGPNQGITMKDFPTINQNNHAILCVPLRKDTVWLECTSQTQPCGYLGTFVQGRTVLMITDNGCKMVKTPLLNSSQNIQCRYAEVEIKPEGNMSSTVKTRFSGYQYDNVSSRIEESQEDQKKDLLEDIGLPGLVISSFAYDIRKQKIPEAIENLSMHSEKYASKTGTRLFIPLNMLNQRKSSPAKVENRKLPVVQTYSYHDKDSIVYTLPAGYITESVPKSKTITTEFGEYRSSCKVEENKAIYVREVKINHGTWPKEKYAEVVDFYSGIVSADKAKLVLKTP